MQTTSVNTAEKTKPQLLTVPSLSAEQRLDNFLIKHLKGLPKSHLYRLLRKGEIRVNKKRTKPDYRLIAGDIIRLPPMRLAHKAPQTKPSENLTAHLKQQILLEDKRLLIINKPTGLAVHGGSGLSLGLIEALRSIYPKLEFLELVHRLDRDTSGCIILAKKPSVLKTLHEQIRANQITKTYHLLVKGYWPEKLRRIDAPLQKNQLQSGERMVRVAAEGKTAITEFKVLQRFANATLLEAKLLTGRTHQIRVHALHAGHPIVGDDKYGDKEFNRQLQKLGCKRLFLHAYSLRFTLTEPIAETINVTAPLSNDWLECLKKLS